jgi:dTMP kinase
LFPNDKGKLIIFEGGDGTGKSTQASRLCTCLREKGFEPLHIREPGSTPLGEKVREILTGEGSQALEMSGETEMLLFMSCRAELFKTVIHPAVQQGRLIVLERSYFSTYAYQGVALGIDPEMILKLGKWVSFGIQPFRVILLDMDVAKSQQRLGDQKDRLEQRGMDFHEKVRSGFLELSRRLPGLFRVVYAEGSVSEVESNIHAELSDLF